MGQKKRVFLRVPIISGLIGALFVVTGAVPAVACNTIEAEDKNVEVTSALLSKESEDLATLKKLDELGARLEEIAARHDAAINDNDQAALDEACKDYDQLTQDIAKIKG